MQILRLLAARRFRGRLRRRAVSTITATAPCTPFYGADEDEGPFFDLDLDLSCCSAPASTAGSQAAESSGSESDDSCGAVHAPAPVGDLDFVISLQRSCSASPSYEERLFFRGAAPPPPPPPPLKFCASESRRFSTSASRRGSGSRVPLRTLSFGSAKAAFYGGGRASSFSRSSSSARSARLFAATYGVFGSPDGDRDVEAGRARMPSGDVFRRYLSKISSRLRRVAVAPAAAKDTRLRKSRSASAAAHQSSPPPRRDDTLLEKQDGIASAIAHCKESLHRASISECETSLLRSRSDPTAAVTTS